MCQAVCPHKYNSKTMLPRPGGEGWLAGIAQTNNIFHTAQLCRLLPCLPSRQPTTSPAKTMLLAGLKPGSAGTGLRWWCQVSPTRADLVSFMPTFHRHSGVEDEGRELNTQMQAKRCLLPCAAGPETRFMHHTPHTPRPA